MAAASSARVAGGDCHNDSPCLEFVLIVLGFMLRDAGPHQGTDKSGNPCPGCCVGKDDSQGACRDGGTDDGNHPRQDPQPREGTQAQAGQGTGQGTRAGMRVMPLIGGIGDVVGMTHGDANLGLSESRLVKVGDGFVGVETVLENADDGGTFLSIHKVNPLW